MDIFIVAGEPSGDLYGARLAGTVRRLRPGARIRGLGGPKMRAAGVEVFEDLTAHSVVGLWEVIGKLRAFRRLLRETAERIRREPPDALVLIDFPDFNLRLAQRAKDAGAPVIYYISPQVWAWREGRVKQIRRLVDKMLVTWNLSGTRWWIWCAPANRKKSFVEATI